MCLRMNSVVDHVWQEDKIMSVPIRQTIADSELNESFVIRSSLSDGNSDKLNLTIMPG